MRRIMVLCLIFVTMINVSAVYAVERVQIENPPKNRVRTEFAHPGILHTEDDFDRIRKMVETETEPWYSAYKALESNNLANVGRSARAVGTISRGSSGDNAALLYTDIAAAYEDALIWKITGSTAHGDTARDILNAWSQTLTTVTGTADRYLASGLYGYQMANAAELMRDYPGFELERMQNMLINVFYKPLCERFLISNEYGADHNDAHVENYWANWDLANMAATVAIGIFCDRVDIYMTGLEYFETGKGNGSIYHAIPYVFEEEGLAQWQESGRDQAHTQLGVGLMAEICEMFWNQGDDMYSWANNRFYKAAEYVARYNNGEDVPYALYQHYSGQNGTLTDSAVVSNASRGEIRNMWDLIFNHYAGRMGLASENITKRALQQRPDGGPYSGAHASVYDLCGFTTLMFLGDDNGEADMPDGNIPDGVYTLKNANSLLYMDEGAETVVQSSREETNSQNWIITHLGGGQYSIINAESKMAVTIENASYENGDNAVEREFTGAENQRFAFLPAGEGYTIIASHSGKPIGVAERSAAVGKNVRQWKYEYSNHQIWFMELQKEAASIEAIEYDKGVFEYDGKVYLKKGEEYTASFKSDYNLSDETVRIIAEEDGSFCVSAYDEDTVRTYETDYVVYENVSDILKEILTRYDENTYYTKESSEEFLSLLKTAKNCDSAGSIFNAAAEKLMQLEKGLEETDGPEISISDSYAEIYSSRRIDTVVIEAVYQNGCLISVKKHDVSIAAGETEKIALNGECVLYVWDSEMKPIREKIIIGGKS